MSLISKFLSLSQLVASKLRGNAINVKFGQFLINLLEPLRGESKIILEEALEESIVKEDVEEIVKRRISMAPLTGSRLNKIAMDPNISTDSNKNSEEIRYVLKPARNHTATPALNTNGEKIHTILETKEECGPLPDVNPESKYRVD